MTSRNRIRSRRRYEGYLDGSRSDDAALSALLDAARAPGDRQEMAGLPAARAAFMSAPYTHARPVTPISRLPAATRTAAGRLLALKLLAGVSGATLIGSAAYAATGATFLGGTPAHHKGSSSSSSATTGGQHGGQQNPLPGVPLGTGSNNGRPVPAGTHSDAANGANSSGNGASAHDSHTPPDTPGQSNAPGPRSSHTPEPSNTRPHPSPTPSNTRPHPSPTPSNTRPPRSPSPGGEPTEGARLSASASRRP